MQCNEALAAMAGASLFYRGPVKGAETVTAARNNFETII
jgi:hypothetical protein